MTAPINLTELRATANQWGSPYAVSRDHSILLALIDTAEAATHPDIDYAIERMLERRTEQDPTAKALRRLRETLTRYTTKP